MSFSWLLKLHDPKAQDFYNTNWPSEKREYIDFDALASHVPPGWRDVLEDLCVKLLALGWNGGFHQVKEKFGTLRFYWGNNIEDVAFSRIAEDVVAQAENLTAQTCATCGKPGDLRGKGWLYVACPEHTDTEDK